MRILSARVICVLVLIASLLIPTPTAAQQALKRVRMGIAYFGGNLIGIWVAKERGFFRTYGLDVQFVQLSGDTLASQALLGGNIDINAGSTIGALAVAAAGGDIIDFAILGPVLPYVFVVRPGIATAQDLRGRRLGLSGPGLSLSRFGVVLALRHLGLDVRKDNIVLQPLGSTPVRLAAMASGALDGTVLNVEEQQMAADRGLKVMVDVTTLGVPVEANALFASRQYAEQNPAVMAGLVKALATANAYVRNPANRHFVAVTMAHSFKLDKVEYGEKASDVAIGRYVLRKPYPSPEGIRNLIDLGKDEFPFLTKADLRTFIEPRWVRELDQVGFFDKLSGR